MVARAQLSIPAVKTFLERCAVKRAKLQEVSSRGWGCETRVAPVCALLGGQAWQRQSE